MAILKSRPYSALPDVGAKLREVRERSGGGAEPPKWSMTQESISSPPPRIASEYLSTLYKSKRVAIPLTPSLNRISVSHLGRILRKVSRVCG